jgi:hypothetical protein
MANTPYMLRWLNTVAHSPDLSWRAKSVAALSIFRHADMRDGANCKVGVTRMKDETGLGRSTVLKGLAELERHGFTRTTDLPTEKWGKEGALRFPTFPTSSQRNLVTSPQGNLVGGTSSQGNRVAGQPQPTQTGRSGLEASPKKPRAKHSVECPSCGGLARLNKNWQKARDQTPRDSFVCKCGWWATVEGHAAFAETKEETP